MTFEGDTTEVEVGSSVFLDFGEFGSATVTVNAPTATLDPAGLSAIARVAAANVEIDSGTDGTASIELLPLLAAAEVPAGGIDCPPEAPTVDVPANSAVINDSTPAYSGTGIPGAIIDLVVDGTTIEGVATVDEDGDWTFTPTAPLADGPHTVSATQSVNDVESESSGVNEFLVDTAAPAAPVITAPEDGSTTTDNTPTITGTGEPGAAVTVEIDGAPVGVATVQGDGTWALPLTEPLDDGEHAVSATQTDDAGNESGSDEVRFVVDTEARRPVITSPEDGSTLDDPTPTIRGTGEPGSTVVVLVDGDPVGSAAVGEDGNWSLTLPEPLADGEHTIAAVAIDEAGNDSGVAGIEITIDVREVILMPTDGPLLADTGGPGLGYAAVGGVLLLVGGTVLSLARRRASPGAAGGGRIVTG